MDGQRSILRSWADADAKVSRIAETTTLEAAMLGLDIGGRLEVPVPGDTGAEHELRRLLDRWWDVARAETVAVIESAQTDGAQWLEVARLASADEPTDGEPIDDEPIDEKPIDEKPAGGTMLPVEVSGVLASLADSSLGGILAALAVVLSDTHRKVGHVSATERATAAVDVAPPSGQTIVLAPDGFDRFWSSNRSIERSPTRRHVVRDALVPMLLVILVLIPVLLLIG
jgi:hypothetical protein